MFPELPKINVDDHDRDLLTPWLLPALEFFLDRLETGETRLLLPEYRGLWENRPDYLFHLESELFLQLQGRCLFHFPYQSIELLPGDILLVPPGMPHLERAGNANGRPFVNLVLMYSGFHFACIANRRSGRPGIYAGYKLERAGFYRSLAASLAHNFDRRSPECEEVRNHLLRGLLLQLKIDLDWKTERIRLESPDPTANPLTERAKEYLERNFPTRFPDVPEVARAVGCTPNYLSSLFRREQGKTIKEFVNDLKFAYALRMLKETGYNLSEIAGSCGFEDVSYFSRKFRERYGKPPAEMR